MDQILPLALGGIRIGAIYGLSAVGLVLIHKATRVVSFAHGALIMLGAYFTFFMLELLGWPYWLAYLAAPVAVGLVAVVLEFLLLRNMRQADMFTVIISTIFISIGLTELMRVAYEAELLALPSFWSGMPFIIGDIIVSRESVWIIFGAIASALAGILIFAQAGMGRSMRAMASSIRGAQLIGYSVDRVYMLAWFIGGAMAGLAGVFIGPVFGVSPDLAIATMVPAFIAAIIGGFNSLIGALFGGIILGLLETMAAAYLSSAMKTGITLLLLLVIMLLRPEGLFASGQKRHV